MRVTGFKFTNDSKFNLVQNLSVALEQSKIVYPNIPVLIEELRAFGFERSESTGKFKYSAPDGKHDDCVTALALATWSLHSGKKLGLAIVDTKQLFAGRYAEKKPFINQNQQQKINFTP